MEAHIFLIQLTLILLSARLMAELAAYFQIPSVMGELFAGLLIGPSVFNLVELSFPLHLLAQIGILLLLFEVGLDTDISRLTSAGRQSFIVATAGVAFPFLLGFFLSYWLFSFSFLLSLFIGSTLTATSIGITLRVLQDLKKQESHEAQIIIGGAVLDDIIGIILLSVLYEFANSGQIKGIEVGKVLLLIILFFILSPLVAKGIGEMIKKWEPLTSLPGLIPTAVVSLILLFAWIAYQAGAPELLGGFAAGLALSKHFNFSLKGWFSTSADFSHLVEKQVKPLIHLFTPIFFVSIGLSLNLKNVNWNSSSVWVLTSSLFLVAVLGKLVVGLILVKEKRLNQWIIGTAMIPRGEVGLIFADIGLRVGVLKDEVYTTLVLVLALTTLCAPLGLRWLYRKKKEGFIH